MLAIAFKAAFKSVFFAKEVKSNLPADRLVPNTLTIILEEGKVLYDHNELYPYAKVLILSALIHRFVSRGDSDILVTCWPCMRYFWLLNTFIPYLSIF